RSAGSPAMTTGGYPGRPDGARSAQRGAALALVVGRPLEIGHHRLDLQARRRDPTAAQPDEDGGALHPFDKMVDVDRLPFELGQDALELGQCLGVTQFAVGRRAHGGTSATWLCTTPSATVVASSSPGPTDPTDRTTVPSARRVMLHPRASTTAGSLART